MQQLEIEFFYPLTEQIPLGLNFKPCQEYEEQKRQQMTNQELQSLLNYRDYQKNQFL